MEKNILNPNIEPKHLFECFKQICKIPRGSGNEKKVSDFLVSFFNECGCEFVQQDELGNIIVRKSANCVNLSNSPMITFQGHLDMVNIKTQESNHDFTIDPIELFQMDDWIVANGTSLGADNGIAVAEIMNIFSNPEIKHGPIEALLTVQEETSMSGASTLKHGLLKGKYLLNLDSEDDDSIVLGCVGMCDIIAKSYHHINDPGSDFVACKLLISDCLGGHSGVEIHKWRINAIKEMFCLLGMIQENYDIRLIKGFGGAFPNSIAENCEIHFCAKKENLDEISHVIEDYKNNLKKFYDNETNFKLVFDLSQENPHLAVEKDSSQRIINTINGTFNGLSLFDFKFNVANTSSNIGVLELNSTSVKAHCLVRSPYVFNLDRLSSQIVSSFRSGNFKAIICNKTEGWVPNYENNVFAKQFKQIYETTFNKKLKMTVTGGGLETAVILTKYPNMHCVSYGATIKDAHTAKERVNITSIQKMHRMVVALLEKIK